MLLRIVEASALHNKGPALESVYREAVMPALEKTPGCLFAGLLQSITLPGNYASITIWKSADDIANYQDSGSYEKNLNRVRPYLDESSEWKIQLSKDDTIEYVPVKQEPVVKSFPVEAADTALPEAVEGSHKYLRALSLKIMPGREDEFRQIYKNEIQAALKQIRGCRYSFLIDNSENENEFLSLTIWDDPESVKLYENEGEFKALLNKVQHTLSELYQWKMALESSSGAELSMTSKDIDISKFTLVTGKKFKG
jgi:heme-degrading monooxygenase HmoA